VVRNNAGEILQNEDVGIRMSIHDSIADGTIVYQETFFQVTNQFGLVNLEIGNGTPTIGTFLGINWGSNPKFLETEIDPTGGSTFVSMGTSELLSVPFALYSETSGGTSKWNQNGDDIYYENGNVGIGTIVPQGEFQINDPFNWEGITFIGSGLNDLNVDYWGYKDIGDVHYIAEITNSFPTPNIFKWSDDNGATWVEDVEMAGRIDVGHDVYIGFVRPNSRHNIGDQWLWTVSEKQDDVFIVKNGMVGIGTEVPDASAILDLNSTEKGMLIPRMTQAEIATIANPANGLQAFNLDNEKLYIYVLGSQEWKEVQYGIGTISSLASYSMGTGGACDNTLVNGSYIDGIPLTGSNTVNIDVSVTSTGNWSISTNNLNGYGFTGSGVFSSTGTKQVTLQGTGTPANAQTDGFTATASNGGGSCTFDVEAIPMPIATFGIGNGGSCSNTHIYGTYRQGVPLNGYNFVTIEVNVISPGTWGIASNTINAYSFIGDGTFYTAGTHTVGLFGSGTPQTGGVDNFTNITNNNGGTCTFSVPVQLPPIVCGNALVDIRDGQSYATVEIGTQCWMSESLNIGLMIPGNWNQNDNGLIEKYCYNNSTGNCNNYGGLYQWNEAMQYVSTEATQGICPFGWHLPTNAE
jgi:hypothetical protein